MASSHSAIMVIERQFWSEKMQKTFTYQRSSHALDFLHGHSRCRLHKISLHPALSLVNSNHQSWANNRLSTEGKFHFWLPISTHPGPLRRNFVTQLSLNEPIRPVVARVDIRFSRGKLAIATHEKTF